jgi:uncharacterized membrane protein YjfL (UPF0719 family)
MMSPVSPDEIFATVTSLIVGPVFWVFTLARLSRVQRLRGARAGIGAIALALAVCAALVLVVLRTVASFDVIDAPIYQLMYVVLGLAWLRIAATTFAFVGLSARDDVVERGNKAAIAAVVGGLLGVTLCYAGGNIGDGPGWWVVVFSAALATGTLLVAWVVLAQLTPVVDTVTIDRDPAAGLRLGTFLTSCGLVLGRGVAGDWYSAMDTVLDFTAALPAVLAILLLAVIVERLARPTRERPHAPFLALGVLPSLVYLSIAAAALSTMGWPDR